MNFPFSRYPLRHCSFSLAPVQFSVASDLTIGSVAKSTFFDRSCQPQGAIRFNNPNGY